MGGVVVPPAQPLFKVEAASMTHSGWQAIEETPPQALGRDFKADLVDLLSSNILQDFGIVHQAAGRSRESLNHFLTRYQGPFDKKTLEKIDGLLAVELSGAKLIDSVSLTNKSRDPRYNISIWKGDITKLKIEAIVNAANANLHGCLEQGNDGSSCVDNAIHAAAGPRLRAECSNILFELDERPIASPIITAGYSLPSQYVVHVVGPMAEFKGHEQPQALAACYRNALDAVYNAGASSVAFCCIATGQRRYPNRPAARVATNAVKRWLDDHPFANMHVVFNTFTERDTRIYRSIVPDVFGPKPQAQVTAAQELAASWIAGADAVLICAGAGMNSMSGFDTYKNEQDFQMHYPELASVYGCRSSYQAMDLFCFSTAAEDAKWRYLAEHILNERWKWPINAGYSALLNMCKGKEHFVWTSNVDGRFERTGFERSKIYTPQGDWKFLQCMNKCSPESLEPSLPEIQKVLASNGEYRPKCKRCGSMMFGNVRHGEWFNHQREYEETSSRLEQWILSIKERGLSLAVIEVGAGFTTPNVTRFPMEAIVNDIPQARLIRINPGHNDVPLELARIGKAVGIPCGWQALEEIAQIEPNKVQLEKQTAMVLQWEDLISAGDRLPNGMSTHWQSFLQACRQ
jgi:O-acetyl-ADP-ribose deacetylase (regulator of RNase III)/NAD-dependent SIR2 family protein deacetylase